MKITALDSEHAITVDVCATWSAIKGLADVSEAPRFLAEGLPAGSVPAAVADRFPSDDIRPVQDLEVVVVKRSGRVSWHFAFGARNEDVRFSKL